MKSWDAIVVGAGIIGLSLAIELNKQGLRVLAVEKGEPGREASWAAGEACIQTHGGFGFAEEYDIERKFRETRLYQVAPISTNLILSYIAEHVLGLPRSY